MGKGMNLRRINKGGSGDNGESGSCAVFRATHTSSQHCNFIGQVGVLWIIPCHFGSNFRYPDPCPMGTKLGGHQLIFSPV